MFLTKKYKTGFIHFSTYQDKIGNKTIEREVIRAQVNDFAYAIEVKSEHAAKLLITKHVKRVS